MIACCLGSDGWLDIARWIPAQGQESVPQLHRLHSVSDRQQCGTWVGQKSETPSIPVGVSPTWLSTALTVRS
jgi:hypothetical protein